MENLHNPSPDTSGIPEIQFETRREMLALFVARYLDDVLDIEPRLHETRIFPQGGEPGMTFYIVTAHTLEWLMEEAIDAGIRECIKFDQELVALGVTSD